MYSNSPLKWTEMKVHKRNFQNLFDCIVYLYLKPKWLPFTTVNMERLLNFVICTLFFYICEFEVIISRSLESFLAMKWKEDSDNYLYIISYVCVKV